MNLTSIRNPIYCCEHIPKSNIYTLTNREGKVVGRMVAHREFINTNDTYNPHKKDYYSLYIKRLFVDKDSRGKGVGKALFDIAAIESCNRKCNGNIHLIAQSIDGSKPPQVFYRKLGFDSQKHNDIEIIDNSIRDSVELPKGHWVTPMYLDLNNMLEK